MTTMQQPPVVPPRPSKSPAPPLVPPRPTSKRADRSRSPNPDRFAQSPFNGGIISKSPNVATFSPAGSNGGIGDAIDLSGSVPMPSVGEEGVEYSAVTNELKHDQEAASRPSSPQQTRTVGVNLKLHAPKPSLPAESAKQRVIGVTRTDSDRAASFGIGKPGHPEDGLAKRSSTSFSTTSEQGYHTDDEHGIPEIGQRVPMNPHLGDVQAPSPAPGSEGHGRHHTRKLSSRSLPPGSYGMHGHGVAPQDELDKAYYKKHPEALQREKHTPLRDRQNDFAMSSSDLNKLVRDTANRATGGSGEHHGTPNDEVAFQASEEYATRMATPRPTSTGSKDGASSAETSDRKSSSQGDDKPIHVDDPKHPEYYSYGVEETPADDVEHEYNAPILADDEVKKEPKGHVKHPAVRPQLERNNSSYDGSSRPASRPSSRPTSIYNSHAIIIEHTPLEDVREYEPLFSDEAAKNAQEKQKCKARHHFPSKDVWEDAPTSVHYTAEVLTPDTTEEPKRKSSSHREHRPITPAQAFALHQEELAEKEANGKKHSFLPIFDNKTTWVSPQTHPKGGKSGGNRFPSRDVWEDTPESLLHEAEISEEPKDQVKPEVPARPSKTPEVLIQPPTIPERPKSRQSNPVDDVAKQVTSTSDQAKPPIPARPVKKSSGDSKDGEFSKPKPPVPSRPLGGKIAALQAGFMSDLNKRLQLGPQAPKKEEPEREEAAEEKEKAPLSDARKGRARGPQRRAPTKSPAPAAARAAEGSAKETSLPTLTFSVPQTIWNIDPEDGDFVVVSHSDQAPLKHVPAVDAESEQPLPTESEKVTEPEGPQKTEAEEEPSKVVAVHGEHHVQEEPRESEPPTQLEEPEAPKEPEESKISEDIKEPEVSKEVEETKEPEVSEEADATKEPEVSKESEESKEAVKPKEPEEPVKETLVANTSGESILEAEVEKKDDKEIELVEVKDEVKV